MHLKTVIARNMKRVREALHRYNNVASINQATLRRAKQVREEEARATDDLRAIIEQVCKRVK